MPNYLLANKISVLCSCNPVNNEKKNICLNETSFKSSIILVRTSGGYVFSKRQYIKKKKELMYGMLLAFATKNSKVNPAFFFFFKRKECTGVYSKHLYALFVFEHFYF